MPMTRTQTVPETRWTVNRMAGALLLGAWGVATLGSFLIEPAMSPRFLDMPLGAFLAGQGALVGLVIIGVRVTRAGSPDREE